MSVKTKITGSNGIHWKIDAEGNGVVTQATHPPIGEQVIGLPFRRYFTDINGSNDMVVNGSVNTIEFSINADAKYDTWINAFNVRLGDAGANFNEFGALPTLTNGIEIVWQSQEVGNFIIHDGIKDNLEWFRLSGIEPKIIDLTGGGADAIIVQVDFSEIFAPPYGIRLKANTTEKLTMKVRDDISLVDTFDVIAYGINIVTLI